MLNLNNFYKILNIDNPNKINLNKILIINFIKKKRFFFLKNKKVVNLIRKPYHEYKNIDDEFKVQFEIS